MAGGSGPWTTVCFTRLQQQCQRRCIRLVWGDFGSTKNSSRPLEGGSARIGYRRGRDQQPGDWAKRRLSAQRRHDLSMLEGALRDATFIALGAAEIGSWHSRRQGEQTGRPRIWTVTSAQAR